MLRRRYPRKEVGWRCSAALLALGAAAAADAGALAGDRQLPALCAFARGSNGGAVEAALTALAKLLAGASDARALQVVRAEGVAAALEAAMCSGNPNIAQAAVDVLNKAFLSAAAIGALLERPTPLVALIVARVAACAPRAAAAEAGAVFGVGIPAERRFCVTGLAALSSLIRHEPEVAFDPRLQVIPTAVALLSHADAGLARQAMGVVAMAAPYIEPARALLALTERGLLRGVEALLRPPRAAAHRGDLGGAEDIASSILQLMACYFLHAPKRVASGGGPVRAWAAAAPRLIELLTSLERGRAAGDVDAGAGAEGATGSGAADSSSGGGAFMEASEARAALKLLLGWAAVARVWRKEGSAIGADLLRSAAASRRISESSSDGAGSSSDGTGSSSDGAGSSLGSMCDGPSGSSGSGSDSETDADTDTDGDGDEAGGSATTTSQWRCCAACGRTRAGGARLRRCRGCGALTGIMYCCDACAREHWVRRGHRGVCGQASRQLKALQEMAASLLTW